MQVAEENKNAEEIKDGDIEVESNSYNPNDGLEELANSKSEESSGSNESERSESPVAEDLMNIPSIDPARIGFDGRLVRRNDPMFRREFENWEQNHKNEEEIEEEINEVRKYEKMQE